MDQILQWFEANAGKIIFLLVAIVAALLITKGLARVMRKVLDRTDMPVSYTHLTLPTSDLV